MFKYVPDTYNYKLIKEKFIDEQQFLQCQVTYKKQFESFLCKYINFNQIEKYIQSMNFDIPRVKDEDYNFYHKFSNIGSNYIYLRNNYHVENLDNDEIQELLQGEKLNDDYFGKTLKKVLFEKGNSTFMGTPMDETNVQSQSIIFEFAFNQKECTSVEQLKKIKEVSKECFKMIGTCINEKFDISVSYLIYNAIPDIFYSSNNDNVKHISPKKIK